MDFPGDDWGREQFNEYYQMTVSLSDPFDSTVANKVLKKTNEWITDTSRLNSINLTFTQIWGSLLIFLLGLFQLDQMPEIGFPVIKTLLQIKAHYKTIYPSTIILPVDELNRRLDKQEVVELRKEVLLLREKVGVFPQKIKSQ